MCALLLMWLGTGKGYAQLLEAPTTPSVKPLYTITQDDNYQSNYSVYVPQTAFYYGVVGRSGGSVGGNVGGSAVRVISAWRGSMTSIGATSPMTIANPATMVVRRAPGGGGTGNGNVYGEPGTIPVGDMPWMLMLLMLVGYGIWRWHESQAEE